MGRRHPGDVVRLFVALVLLLAASLAACRGTASASEIDVFRLFNDLPRAFGYVRRRRWV